LYGSRACNITPIAFAIRSEAQAGVKPAMIARGTMSDRPAAGISIDLNEAGKRLKLGTDAR
jgi:hypothetical protein